MSCGPHLSPPFVHNCSLSLFVFSQDLDNAWTSPHLHNLPYSCVFSILDYEEHQAIASTEDVAFQFVRAWATLQAETVDYDQAFNLFSLVRYPMLSPTFLRSVAAPFLEQFFSVDCFPTSFKPLISAATVFHKLSRRAQADVRDCLGYGLTTAEAAIAGSSCPPGTLTYLASCVVLAYSREPARFFTERPARFPGSAPIGALQLKCTADQFLSAKHGEMRGESVHVSSGPYVFRVQLQLRDVLRADAAPSATGTLAAPVQSAAAAPAARAQARICVVVTLLRKPSGLDYVTDSRQPFCIPTALVCLSGDDGAQQQAFLAAEFSERQLEHAFGLVWLSDLVERAAPHPAALYAEGTGELSCWFGVELVR
jgi:hypothetical protein